MYYNAKKVLKLLLCFIIWTVCVSQPLNNQSSNFELSIIHFSDFHARYVPIAPYAGLCYDSEKEKCVGGIARVASIVDRLKKIRRNPIFLNAGDCFQGTLYYELFRGNITAYFMNKLPHDVMTLGNHDFDDGISGLVNYIKQLNAPVVVTNIDKTDEPSTQNLFTNSTVIYKGDKKIGVIGVIYSDTDKISTTTEKLKFLNEVETVNLEAKKLKAKGINIIIVLSHCGIEHDKIMASSCPDIDVIVGGHSHIFLYNGNPPSNDIAYDKYPVVVTQEASNRTVLIVHSGPFTKYMGDIRVVFDEEDEVTRWKGNPIYLDSSIPEDSLILEELEPWKIKVQKIAKQYIAKTLVYLNGSCSSGECNLANLISDAMVDKYANNASISMTTSVVIQNSIPEGSIVYEDVYATLPNNNTWDLIELRGSDLLQVLEENVAQSMSNSSFMNIKLLQWSGLKVVYNLTSEHSKVVNVKVRCHDCKEEKFEDLNINRSYKIVVQAFLLTEYFETISKKHRNRIIGKSHDVENLIDYLKKIKTVNTKTESRMVFI